MKEHLQPYLEREKFPKVIPPMRVHTQWPPDLTGWGCEVKWDGWRAVSYVRRKKPAEIRSKSGNIFTQFRQVADALQGAGQKLILDGELVTFDDEGKQRLQNLRGRRGQHRNAVFYFVFDVLHIDGYSVRNAPLAQRKQMLREVLPQHPLLRYVPLEEEHPAAFLEGIMTTGLEGMIVKDPNSKYQPETGAHHHAARARSWVKILNPEYKRGQ